MLSKLLCKTITLCGLVDLALLMLLHSKNCGLDDLVVEKECSYDHPVTRAIVRGARLLRISAGLFGLKTYSYPNTSPFYRILVNRCPW
jgi:hypothetical protein